MPELGSYGSVGCLGGNAQAYPDGVLFLPSRGDSVPA